MIPFTRFRPADLLRWLCAAALWFAALLPAQATLRLADDQADVDAWPAVTMLADPAGTLDAASALLRRAQFQPPQTPRANLGLRRDAVWLHVPLALAHDSDGRWILELDYASLDRVDVHVISGGRVVQTATLGDHLTYEARPLASRPHAVSLRLERGVEHELLLRVQTRSTMIVPLRLMKATTFHAREMRVQLLQGLAAGLGLSLLMYALTQWVGSRDPMFLYYAVTIAGTTMFFFAYYGLAPQHLWPAAPWPTDNMAPLAVLVALGGGMLLIERMLDVRTLSPGLARAAYGVAALAWLAALAFALDLLPYRAAQLTATVLGPLPMLLAVPVAWVRWRRGDRAAPYLFAGWAVYAVGVVVMAALLRGWIDSTTFTQHAFQAGATFEMLMWLRVLGVRNDEARRLAESASREREVMQALAHTDPLTALPNRRGLELELQAALAATAAGDRMLGVYVLDLDGFKAVNDRLGHAAGDELLVAVARRLKGALRHRDVVARLGGDEFVILARDLVGERDAWALGDKLLDAFAQPFVLRQELCRVGLTVGFALSPHDGRDGGALLRRADAAMYAGKQGGKGTVRRGAASVGLSGA